MMKTILAGFAAAGLLAAASPQPAAAMPLQSFSASKADGGAYTEIQYRRNYRHRRVYVGPRYVQPYPYAYSYGPAYQYYAPAPFVRVGPLGFGFW